VITAVRERATALNLVARNRLLEHQLAAARGRERIAWQRAAKARDDARFLHGVLLLHGIDVPERLKP
jgi:hypothetical protein